LEEHGDEYGDDVDEEALGAALYLEGIVSGDADDRDITDIADYMVGQDDFNYSNFKDYKAELGNDYEDIGDAVVTAVESIDERVQRSDAVGAIYQSLYEEVKNERDSALGAIGDIIDEISDLDVDSDWFDDIDRDTDIPDIPDDIPEGAGGEGGPDGDDTDDTGDDSGDETGDNGPGPDGGADGGDGSEDGGNGSGGDDGSDEGSGYDEGSSGCGFSWTDIFGEGSSSSGEFSTWSNYKCGNQALGPGFSTWSNYNFGNQTGLGDDWEGEDEETEQPDDWVGIDDDWSEDWVYNPQNVNIINVDVE